MRDTATRGGIRFDLSTVQDLSKHVLPACLSPKGQVIHGESDCDCPSNGVNGAGLS